MDQMEIPSAPKHVCVDQPSIDPHAEKKKMIAGILGAITNPGNRHGKNKATVKAFGQYCYHCPYDIQDRWDVIPKVMEEVKTLFENKGWTVEIEDLSDMDGTITFQLTSV